MASINGRFCSSDPWIRKQRLRVSPRNGVESLAFTRTRNRNTPAGCACCEYPIASGNASNTPSTTTNKKVRRLILEIGTSRKLQKRQPHTTHEDLIGTDRKRTRLNSSHI